jgi:hypothetical protein
MMHVSTRQSKMTKLVAEVRNEMNGNATTMQRTERGEGMEHAAFAAVGVGVAGRNLMQRKTMGLIAEHASGDAKIGATEAEDVKDVGHDSPAAGVAQ